MCECSWFHNAIAFANYCYTIVLIENNVLLVCVFHQHLLSRWEMFREYFFHGNSWYHPKKKQNKLIKYKIIIVKHIN